MPSLFQLTFGKTRARMIVRISLWGAIGSALLFSMPVAHAQVLQQYLPDNLMPVIGQAGPAIAPDVTATPRGEAAIQPNDTVTTRLHPDYNASGVHVGDFYIRPQLTENAGYNSNLFADKSGRGAYFVTTIPSFSLASDWARNSIQAYVQAENTYFPSYNTQNFTNVVANIAGTYDIGRDQLRMQYTHGSLHIARGTIDADNFDRPVPFTYDDLHVSYLIPFARFSFEPAIDVSRYHFQNGTLNGAVLDETGNNRNAGQLMLTTRYDLAPLRSLVLVVSGAAQDFYSPQPSQPTRNSRSAEVLGGIDFNFNALFRIRLLAGYEQRNFTSSTFPTRSAPIVNADVVWTPSDLTTLTMSVNRSIEDGLSSSVGGFTYTSGKLSVDHELLRNVLLNGHIQAQLAEFPTNQGTQDIYSVGGSASWLLNRNLALIGRYDFANRQATETQGLSYSQNILLLGFRLKI